MEGKAAAREDVLLSGPLPCALFSAHSSLGLARSRRVLSQSPRKMAADGGSYYKETNKVGSQDIARDGSLKHGAYVMHKDSGQVYCS